MKICYIINNLNRKAGTEKATVLVANKIASLGFDVTIMSFIKVKEAGYKLNENIKVVDLGFDEEQSLKLNYFKVVLKIRNCIKENSFDFVVEAEVYNRLFTVLALKNIKTKVITWEHFNYFVTLGRKERAFARKLAARYSDAIITLTEKDRKNYLSNLKCRGIVRAIGNPVEFVSNNGCDYKSKNILAIGRYTYQKGFDVLLKCWKKIQDSGDFSEWTLNIVGDGEEKENLKSYIQNNNLQDVVQLCEPTSNIQDYYMNSSLYLMTSRFEGLPMVLIEAMSFGIPVVSLDCQTGPSELIDNGQNGFICDINDCGKFCECAINLMSDIVLREQLGMKAKEIRKKLDISKISQKWVEIFKELEE